MKRFFLFLLVFLPLYLVRLRQEPVYDLPTDERLTLEGKITSQPYLKATNQIIKMGPILMVTDRFPSYYYGEKIRLNGSLSLGVINKFEKRYFAYFPAIERVEMSKEEARKRDNALFPIKVKTLLERRYFEYFEEPLAGLMSGIVIGSKSGLSEIFSQKLRETGTIHAVVASGQNVSLLVWLLMAGFGLWAKRGVAVAMTIAAVSLYVMITGGEAPVIRAAIMAVIVFGARWLGRETAAELVLVATGALMLLVRPLLLFDLGFQLSFAATAGLLWLTPRLKNWPLLGGESFAVEAIRSTLAAQIAVVPILLTSFGELSLISPAVNAMVIWTTPLIMFLGLVSGIIGLVSRLAGQLVAWLAWPLLQYFVEVVEVFSRLPWASIKVGRWPWLWAVAYYAILIVWVKKAGKDERN